MLPRTASPAITAAVVFLDAIVVEVRDNQVVQNKPAYIAIGVDADGEKHVLGIWLAKTPPQAAAAGARFWGSVMADLRNRGVRDILIACVDGLADFADAITAAFPAAVVQRCVVHLIRNSLRPVARRDAAELPKIYTAPTAEAAFDAVVKLLWLAIVNIEDKRAREREARRAETGKRSDQPARIVEGQRVMGWREALKQIIQKYLHT